MSINSELSDALPQHTRETEESYLDVITTVDSELSSLTRSQIYEVSEEIANSLLQPVEALNERNQNATIKYYDILGLTVPLHNARADNIQIENISDLADFIPNPNSGAIFEEVNIGAVETMFENANDATGLLKPLFESIRKISSILEGTGRSIGLTNATKSVASGLATFNSIYGLLYSIYNFVTICVKIEQNVSSKEELDSQQSEKYVDSFVTSLGLVIAECMFFACPYSFNFAWIGTRKISNLGLYKLRRYSKPSYQFLMSRSHYFLRESPTQILREAGSVEDPEEGPETNLQELLGVVGSTASKTALLAQLERAVESQRQVETRSEILFEEITEYLYEMLEFCKEKTRFDNETIQDVESKLENVAESDVVEYVSGQGNNLLEAVDQVDISNNSVVSIIADSLSWVSNVTADILGNEITNALFDVYEKIMGAVKSILNQPEAGVIQYPDIGSI